MTGATLPNHVLSYGFGTASCGAADAGKNGNRTTFSDAYTTPTATGTLNTSYCYDSADRLTGTTNTGAPTGSDAIQSTNLSTTGATPNLVYDPRGNTTAYSYYADTTADHTLGDLQSVTDAAGLVTQYTKYNPHGQVLQTVDPNGVTADYTYDLRMRPTSASSGGQTTSYAYWPTGLPKQVTLPDASTLHYAYDDAHRLTDISDSLGNSVHYTLDAAGNRTKEELKDANGALSRSLSRVMDALSRVQQTTGRE